MAKKEVLERISGVMSLRENIRNISVIAHVDHGKSTLTDSLIAAAGLISQDQSGTRRFMDIGEEEQKRGITIKSTSISMVFDVVPPKPKVLPKKGQWKPALKQSDPEPESKKPESKDEDIKNQESIKEVKQEAAKVQCDKNESKEPFLVNLIDSPGHVDFSSEVTAALRVSDGALVVVDCVEGVCVQTQTVLRQAMAERIKPVLFVNKLDRMFTELKMEPEEAYQTLQRSVESVNVIISSLPDSALGDVTVWPQNGSVAFGSGLQGWGFTLSTIADMYHEKFNISKKKMMKKLWGDNFWDPKKKKWSTSSVGPGGRKLVRGFCLLVLEPIRTLFDAILQDKPDVYRKFVSNRKLKLPKESVDQSGKALLKTVMQNWISAADALLEMIVHHLPSPVIAQRYRVDTLYSGPLDDETACAIRNCDPSGPLFMYVSKMVPTLNKTRFYAFGRVFSGTLSTGQAVRIQGPDYIPGEKKDLATGTIQGCVLLMGPYVQRWPSFPCGSIAAVLGVDQHLVKNGTLTTCPTAHNIVSMKHSVAPVVRVAVEPANPAHLSKLTEGLRRLVRADPLICVFRAPTGEHIVAGCGELHLETCLRELEQDFMRGCPIKISQPIVTYRESVSAPSAMTCAAKSPNKLNRIWTASKPVAESFSLALEEHGSEVVKLWQQPSDHAERKSGKSASASDAAAAAGLQEKKSEKKSEKKDILSEFGLELSESKKIWAFGISGDSQANLLLDQTKGCTHLHEAKDTICQAFQEAVLGGVYADEPLRGVMFELMDVKLHSDSAHRGVGQVAPATKRALYAAQMQSRPVLLEPVFRCDITAPRSALPGVYSTLRARRAVLSSSDEGDQDLNQRFGIIPVRAFLPVSESFGFTELLRKNTSGQAFPQTTFSHWQPLRGELTDPSSVAATTALAIRNRKGLSPSLPVFGDYNCNDIAPPPKAAK